MKNQRREWKLIMKDRLSLSAATPRIHVGLVIGESKKSRVFKHISMESFPV